MTDALTTMTDGQLGDALAAARAELDAAAASMTHTLGANDRELEQARRDSMLPSHLEALRARNAEIARVNGAHLERRRERLEALQAEHARRATLTEEAAERGLHADLLRRYLAGGGRLSDFEAAYPGLRQRELERRTIERDMGADQVADKRARAWRATL